MRISLLNLPWALNGRLGVRAGSRWPFTTPVRQNGQLLYIPFPFFLAYSAALLKKNNNSTLIIDAVAEGLGEKTVLDKLKGFSPELLSVETSTPSFSNDLRIIGDIRRDFPKAEIALCGPHASVFGAQILKENKEIDYVLAGEYEYTLLELASSLKKKKGPGGIAGLIYRDGTGVRSNPRRPAIKDLDELPWPEREDLPIYRYNDAFAGLPIPNVQMLSSRGCPFACGFCLWPQVIYGGHSYRMRDPSKVVDEMEYLAGRFGFKAVYFDDDTFNIDKGHVLDICAQIRKRKINIPWAAMARPDLMDGETLREASRAGLYAVKYGIESADERVLKLSGKELDLSKAEECIRLTKKLGIKVHLTFCLGLKGETKESINKTLRFKEKSAADSFQFSLAVPFPGTRYFEEMKKDGLLLSQDWDDYDGNLTCVIKTADLEARELERLNAELNSPAPGSPTR